MVSARLLALYLPQFHPVPENDEWWGKGFTEWTNVAKARKLFSGHYQPHIPADLGFYDLRVPEVRLAQAEMARAAGIEGFCYYHYWFAGRRILERPFTEVLESRQPDFPFCLCWANETWSGIWHGAPDRVLIEQTYPGVEDHRKHFATLLPAFRDDRYIQVNGKPVFLIYKPEKLPKSRETISLWRDMAHNACLKGLHVMGMSADLAWTPTDNGFDAKVVLPSVQGRVWVSRRTPLRWAKQKLDLARKIPTIHDYNKIMDKQVKMKDLSNQEYPCLVHAWDNTPRSGANGVVFSKTNAESFRPYLREAVAAMQCRAPDDRIILLKSWNEWAEGNHLEPDLKDGHSYLRMIQEEMGRSRQYAATVPET